MLGRRRFLFSSAGAAAFLGAAARGDGTETFAPAQVRGTAKQCVFVQLAGAPSQLDTFNPQDGAWNPTDADIVQLGRNMAISRTLFPKLSRTGNDLVFLNSVNSWELAHERGTFYLYTAHPMNPAFEAESPHIGAVIANERGQKGAMPPFMALNSGAMQGAKFLGGVYEPFGVSPSAGGLSTLEHNYFGAQSRTRFEQRFQLLQDLDAELRGNPRSQGMADQAAFSLAAKQLMYSPVVSKVFQFSADEAAAYGNSGVGNACLVARNAIRAKEGVSYVHIQHGGWDTHFRMFDRSYNGSMYQLANQLDAALGALIADLKESNDFDSTLIVVMGEFGRTPGELNLNGGRDHHRNAMSVMMAGGGTKGGRAIGITDRDGADVTTPGWKGDRPIYPEDIAATIYSALGINWTRSISDTPSGRRFEYVPYSDQGKYMPVDEVFS
jgi:hypothetical protein